MASPKRTMTFANAALLMTATSFLVPLGGLLTAPVLARALGVDDRGLVAAAGAPSLLMIGAITLGLPEAVIYFVARQPSLTRRALGIALGITTLLGLASLGVVWLAVPFLSDGSDALARLILIATATSIPTMWVTVLRGAAIGRQRWKSVALERIVLTVLRVGLIVGLALASSLDILTAVLIAAIAPAVAGLVYLPLVLSAPPRDDDRSATPVLLRPLLSYSMQMWLGSFAVSVLARFAALLMVPLSDETQLGLYTVAVTISDIPWIVATTLHDTLFGASSRDNDGRRIARTCRVTLLAGIVGCVFIALATPIGIGPVFGEEFVAATGPTLVLLVAALVALPGYMAASGLAAWGRPATRSIGFVVTLVVNVVAFVLLVPHLGVYGAALTNVLSGSVLSVYMLVHTSKVVAVPVHEFLVLRREDIAWLRERIRARRTRPVQS